MQQNLVQYDLHNILKYESINKLDQESIVSSETSPEFVKYPGIDRNAGETVAGKTELVVRARWISAAISSSPVRGLG